MRECDRRRIAVDGYKLTARLLGACGSDTAHRIHDGAELADTVDARADVGEALGHGRPANFARRGRLQRLSIFSQRFADRLLSGVVECAGILDATDDIRDIAVKRLAQPLPEHSHGRQRQRIQ